MFQLSGAHRDALGWVLGDAIASIFLMIEKKKEINYQENDRLRWNYLNGEKGDFQTQQEMTRQFYSPHDCTHAGW